MSSKKIINCFVNFRNFLKKSIKKDIGLHEPEISLTDKKNVLDCLNSTYVSTAGKYVKIFEQKIKKLTKSKYVVALNSGTSALHLALKSVNVCENTYVIMSPITFVATGNAVKYNNAKILFVDVDLKNYGMCADALERVLKRIALVKRNYCLYKKDKKRISCILPTHVFGISCDITKIKKIADKFKIPIVEDAAEGLGSFYKGKHLGLFGKVGILSFNGNKIITTGSGGAIITNSKRIYHKIYHLASVSKKNHPWKFYHDEVGYNYRMNNISAALGVAQISKIKFKIKYKKKLYQLILKKFLKLKNDIKFYKPNINLLKWNYWLISLKIKNSLKVRNGILDDFNKNGIQIRPLWEPLNTLPHFKNDIKFNLKNSLELYNETILLPSSPQLYKKIINDKKF